MNNEKDYASESDSSDEDFCPEENAGEHSSDDEVEDDDGEDVEETDESKKHKRKGKGTKRKACAPLNDVEVKRSTRHSRQSGKTERDNCQEKEEIESDDDEKARADALWADFLGDVKHSPVDIKKPESTSKPTIVITNGEAPSSASCGKTSNCLDEAPKKVTITEVLDFAGEEVRIEKTVNADSVKENKNATLKSSVVATSGRDPGIALKRTVAPSSSGCGGLGSLLSQIGKKKKISVLEKTKMDWNTFKKDEGIEEQLQTFNKGKDGFLERQDFLERTDLRQFEIERNLRQTRRNQ